MKAVWIHKNVQNILLFGILVGGLIGCQPQDNLLPSGQPTATARVATNPALKQSASLIAEALEDPALPVEVYQRVLLGYEGSAALPITFLLGGTMPEAKPGKHKDKLKADRFEKMLKQKDKKGDLTAFITANDIEIYWPYWQEWDGRELPTISFTPEVSTTEGVGYKLVRKNNKVVLEQVRVDDDYAYAHPVWILQQHQLASVASGWRGRFLPNFMQGPKLPIANMTSGARIAFEEDLPADDPGYDPGYSGGGSGSSDLGPGFVPGPMNGTADVNELYIEHVRTDGNNFRDIFSGIENVIIFHLGDMKRLSTGQDYSTEVKIDRWAGRRGVWRQPHKKLDENWSFQEKNQFVGIETVKSGVSIEYNVTFKIKYHPNGAGNMTNPNYPQYPGNWTDPEPVEIPLEWPYKKVVSNEFITTNGEMNRRIFFAGNTGDVEGHGILDGNGIRFGGNTRNSGVYYTLKMVCKNRQ
jgi:hypothetical protein